MDVFVRSGIKTKDAMTEAWEIIDRLGDATGMQAGVVASELIPVFKALGMGIQDIEKYSDAMVYAVNNSTLSLSDMAFYVRRYGEDFVASGMNMYDIIALFQKFADLGITGRPMMMTLNQIFKEAGSAAEIAAKGEKALLEVQEKLNSSQKEGKKTTREYLEDMQRAGGDVSKMRDLTFAYNRSVRDRKEKEEELLTTQKATQKAIDTAKSAPPPDILAIAEKLDPRMKKSEMVTASALLQSPGIAGSAVEYQKAAEFATATEIANFRRDELLRKLGEKIPPEVGADLAHLRDISAGITLIASAAALIQTFTAATAVATTATAAQGGATGGSLMAGMNALLAGGGATAAGAVAGGGLLGLAAVYGMEQMGFLGLEHGITGGKSGKAGWVEQKGAEFRNYLTGDQSAFIANYVATHNGEYPPGYDPVTGTWAPISEYAEGGVVPGMPGASSLAIVHGGENIIPQGMMGFSFSIMNAYFSKDYPLPSLVRDYERIVSTKRKQGGVRTAQ